jgi:hypothetical protein
MEESLNEYYKLKDTYDTAREKDKKTLLNNKQLSRLEKKREFKQYKPKCVNCKRPVGTLFSSKYNTDLDARQLKAICGSLSDPCDLNISIHLGECYNLFDNIRELEKELLEQKNRIIEDKNRLLFGYTTPEKVVDNFEKRKETIDTIQFLLNNDYEKLFSLVDNAKKDLETNTIQENVYSLIQQIKEIISNYTLTNEIQKIRDTVELYIHELQPKLLELQKHKYSVHFVEFNPDENMYRLVQQKIGLLELETFIVEPKVERFDVGILSKKKMDKNDKNGKTEKTSKLGKMTKNKTRKQRESLVIEEESPPTQNQTQNKTQIDSRPIFNDDGTLTWQQPEYQTLWNKLSTPFQKALMTDEDWLQDTMNSFIQHQREKKQIEFVHPKDLFLPPQLLDNGKYDFGNTFYNDFFNSLEPSYRDTLLSLHTNDNYSMFLDALSNILKQKFQVPRFF